MTVQRDVTEIGLKAPRERGASDELLAAASRPVFEEDLSLARTDRLLGPRFWLVVLRVACTIGPRRMRAWAALRLWDAS